MLPMSRPACMADVAKYLHQFYQCALKLEIFKFKILKITLLAPINGNKIDT